MPRRVRRKSKGSYAPAKTREPLAEGIRKRKPRGFYTNMSDETLVAFAKRFMKESGISGRSELGEADAGLYKTLLRRKLLDKVGFEKKRRNWNSHSDAQLVEHARKFIEEKGINGRKELEKADNGLYNALLRRKLLDKVGFEKKRRNWNSHSDAQLVEHTKKFMEERGISGRTELEKADKGLHHVLRRRKLLGMVGFEERRRNWAPMSDEGLAVFAKKLVEEKNITSRGGLVKDDYALYEVLRKRNLLDRVFEDIEQAKEREEAQALFDGLAEFGGAE